MTLNRYFKAVMPNGDLLGLFQSNSDQKIQDETNKVRVWFSARVVEVEKTEYEALNKMSKSKAKVNN